MNNQVEKNVYGSNLTILAFNGNAKIPILYGGHILITESSEELVSEGGYNLITEEEISSINITIKNADSSKEQLYSFPLAENQILTGNDYIDSEGLHINGSTIAFSSEQATAYEKLQDIPLYEGINHIIVTDNVPAVLKLTYFSDEEEDNQIYVLNKNEQILAVFNKDDEETLINPRIEKKQNSEAIFTFSIDTKNPKWKEINNPENLYLVDGMMFSTNFDGSFKENITENDEQTVEVTAYERQQLLSRKFVRAWNSETNLERIDTFMVVILSNGNLDLKNNDTIVTTRYPKGSSGYALEGLLYGTGWTVGICDIYEYENGELVKDENDNPVYLKFDLETDQMTIYENILKIQELWGGILVFDSVNKIVHHRNESLYLPYNGYEVKYEKNMQSLEKTYNNKIITKLCPLGEGGLNIKSVNNDSVWLENYSYTNTILEGIENNPDITDSKQLKKWGERKLEMLSKPSIELDVNVALLYRVEGYELESVDLNDIVRVIGYQKILPSLVISENTIIGEDVIIGGTSYEELRIVEFSYSLWDKSDATIKLSNITLDSTDIFRKTINATNSINAGTLDASKVTTQYKGGESVEKTIFNIDEEKLNEEDFTGPNIILAINDDGSSATINADKVSLHGKTINLTSDLIDIQSDNFNVDEDGTMSCQNANIKGKITVGGDEEDPEFISTDGTNRTYIFPLGLLNEVNGKFAAVEKGGFGVGTYSSSGMIENGGFDTYNIHHEATYNNTSSSSANVRIDSAGYFYRATGSSKRWKTDISEKIEERLNPHKLYELPIKQFKYKENYLNKNDKRYNKNILGFIAEDVQEIYEPAVEYDENGQVEMWNSDVMIPAMLKLIQDQHTEIEQMKKEIKELKGDK